LEKRAKRSSKAKFKNALSKISDTEPEEFDRLKWITETRSMELNIVYKKEQRVVCRAYTRIPRL